MGLSRNKVAVSEGAAGSPPFYGDRDRFSRICRKSLDEIGITRKRVRIFCCSIFRDQKRDVMIFEKARARVNGGVAQLGEHLPCKQGVMGSNPIISTSPQCGRPIIGDMPRVIAALNHKGKTREMMGRIKAMRTVCSSGG